MLTIAGLQVYIIITTQNLVRPFAMITALKIARHNALRSLEHGRQVRIIHPRLPRCHRPTHPMFHHHSYHSQSYRHCDTLPLSRCCCSCIALSK